MGLDSLMAFELLNRLEIQFGISLPPGKISANSTINKLAAVVLEIFGGDTAPAPAVERENIPAIGPMAGSSKHLLTLRAGSSGGPVYFIHPAGGLANIYRELAAQLPGSFPIFGIQSRAFSGADDEWTSVEAMARDYAGLIAKQQPDGAVRLAGFSVGGLFALATAGELEQRGRKVSFAGMIDTLFTVLAPDCPQELVLKSLIAEMYDYFTDELALFQPRETGDLSGRMMELAEKTMAVDEATQLRLVMDWLAELGLGADAAADSGMKKFFEVFIRHVNLIRSFKLKTVQAPVRAWRAGRSRLSSLQTAPEIGRQLTRGRFTEEALDGSHFGLMHPPLVKNLAGRIAGALAESENTGRGNRRHGRIIMAGRMNSTRFAA